MAAPSKSLSNTIEAWLIRVKGQVVPARLSTRTHAPRSTISEAGDMKLLVRLAVILGGSLLFSIVMTN
ncbi:hypothetical protein, partial [Nocardioides sp. NPDC127503]|uniref:hypothetical protein n=1 Tax=Nocardioides sp. NPDC127503 TaxID=3154516 RepID=UPI003327D3DC